jgi:hypothetical protein
MSSKFSLKVLAGAIALAIGGTAMADTTLDGASTGDVFLNIVDTTNNTSFVFDTGVSQAAFNGNGSYQYNLASDPNYVAFLKSGDTLDYSVFSSTKPTSTSAIVDFSSSIALPTTLTSGNVTSGATALANFLIGANSISSTTTNSALITGSLEFGTALNEGVISKQLLNNGNVNLNGGYATDAAIGTALAFYQDAASRTGGVTTNGSAFAGTWDLSSAGVLTYSAGTTAVPLPTPMLLLLSGLGFMGVVARRSKAA